MRLKENNSKKKMRDIGTTKTRKLKEVEGLLGWGNHCNHGEPREDRIHEPLAKDQRD